MPMNLPLRTPEQCREADIAPEAADSHGEKMIFF